jgi:N-acetylglucosamine malate deacetylase 1
MKVDFQNDRALAVVAHPDDVELLCAGTLARAREDGAAIAICVCCRGDKGQPAKPIANLAAVRQREMQAAARLLQAELFTLKVADSALDADARTRAALTEIFRRFKPTLVLAHAPEDYHADHRAASLLAEICSWSCASKGFKTKSSSLASPPALWWMDTLAGNGFTPGFFVDISPYLEVKQRMLACHKSQLARGADQDFSPLAELLCTQAQMRGLQSGVEAAEAFRIHQAFKRCRAM